MKHYLIFVAVGVSMLASSCSKFLEESTQSELIPRSAETLNEYLLGDAYPNTFALNPLEMYMNDDIGMIAYVTTTSTHAVYTWQPNMVETGLGAATNQSSWKSIYAAIQACNTTLDYLPKVTGTEAFKSYVAGQAQLLRAFYYFNLVNIYGLPYNDKLSDPKTNLGVPLLLSGGVETTLKTRNSVADIYSQIEKDLKEGTALIDQSKQVHSKYRFGSAAAHLLASRVYLYMEKWDEVIKHTDPLLNGPYQLMDLRNWGEVKPLDKPVISAGNPETIWAFGLRGDVIMQDTSAYRMPLELRNSYSQGDLRHGVYWADGVTKKLHIGDFGLKSAQAFRLSEAYLNRAEALAQLYKQGNADAGQKCVNLINSLREKRFQTDKYTPWKLEQISNDILQYIRDERRRELYSEGGRWFDLRRYGMPRIQHTFFTSTAQNENYILQERDPSYVQPIPLRVIDLNPKIIQNPLSPIRQPKN